MSTLSSTDLSSQIRTYLTSVENAPVGTKYFIECTGQFKAAESTAQGAISYSTLHETLELWIGTLAARATAPETTNSLRKRLSALDARIGYHVAYGFSAKSSPQPLRCLHMLQNQQSQGAVLDLPGDLPMHLTLQARSAAVAAELSPDLSAGDE